MSRVGEKVKTIRESKGMSQKQLAKKLGVSEAFINEVECGRKIINQTVMDKLSKALGKDIDDITMSFEEEVFKEEKVQKYAKEPKKAEVKDIWNEAFGSVLKNVPIYKYDLAKPVGFKQLPIVNNKIEGHTHDKVIYLEIEENDMIGFRIVKDDMAFGVVTHEIDNNSICLIEHGGERVVRQVKRLDSSKILLISNKGSLRTETVDAKEIKVLVKLERLEIKL